MGGLQYLVQEAGANAGCPSAQGTRSTKSKCNSQITIDPMSFYNRPLLYASLRSVKGGCGTATRRSVDWVAMLGCWRTLQPCCFYECSPFLQRAQCSHCKRCISYGNSVRPYVRLSVRLSHAGIVSKRRHVARCSLHPKCV